MSSMTITAEDIAREHRDALASITPVQRRALERMRVARQRCRFNGHYVEENLQAVFEAEATARAEAAAAAPAPVAQAHEGPLSIAEEQARLADAVARGFPLAA